MITGLVTTTNSCVLRERSLLPAMSIANYLITAVASLRVLAQKEHLRCDDEQPRRSRTASELICNSFDLQNLAISAANLQQSVEEPRITSSSVCESATTERRTCGALEAEEGYVSQIASPTAAVTFYSQDVTDETEFEGHNSDELILNADALHKTSLPSRNYTLLNVGGTHFRISTKKLMFRCPLGRLAKMTQCRYMTDRLKFCDDYFEEAKEYYFERPANVFYCIYNYYVTGELHRAPDICHEQYIKELQYWNIPTMIVPKCCRKADVRYATALETAEEVSSMHDVDGDEFTGLWLGKMRRSLWRIMEIPNYNRLSRALVFVSVFFVALSIVVLILGSLPPLQVRNMEHGLSLPFDLLSGHSAGKNTTQPHVSLQLLEIFCNVWFSLEYFSRLLVSPRKWGFVSKPLNVVDAAAVITFYAETILAVFKVNPTKPLHEFNAAAKVVRMVRVMRVLRIVKLARYSAGIQAFLLTLRRSLSQLGLMLMLLSICILFFATTVYYMENEEPDTEFYSIPASFWWCLVTMTTVGYGDIVPKTIMGKVVGSGAILLGTLVVALPMTVIVENFQRTVAAMRKRHKERLTTLFRPNSYRSASGASVLQMSEDIENGNAHRRSTRVQPPQMIS